MAWLLSACFATCVTGHAGWYNLATGGLMIFLGVATLLARCQARCGLLLEGQSLLWSAWAQRAATERRLAV